MKPCAIAIVGLAGALVGFMVVHLTQLLTFSPVAVFCVAAIPCVLLGVYSTPLSLLLFGGIALRAMVSGSVLGVGLYTCYWGYFWSGLFLMIWGAFRLGSLFPKC
jgi:hypothetical protein